MGHSHFANATKVRAAAALAGLDMRQEAARAVPADMTVTFISMPACWQPCVSNKTVDFVHVDPCGSAWMERGRR